MPLITTPIFINTIVVLVRIYWFEQRFRNIVRDSKIDRRSKTKDESRNPGRENVPLEGDAQNNNGKALPPMARGALVDSSEHTDVPKGDHSDAFYSPVTSSGGTASSSVKSGESLGTPGTGIGPSNNEENRIRQHIAFVERQRSPLEEETLRIPGPRDFDRGVKPHTLQPPRSRANSEVPPLIELDLLQGRHEKEAKTAVPSKAAEHNDQPATEDDGTNDLKIRRAITFDTQNDRPPPQAASAPVEPGVKRASTTGDVSKKPGTSPTEPGFLRRIRSGQPLSRSTSRTESVDHALPYLSYAPTVGRNSTFVNLTQEQREELGGIEYRALKTLAIILVGELA